MSKFKPTFVETMANVWKVDMSEMKWFHPQCKSWIPFMEVHICPKLFVLVNDKPPKNWNILVQSSVVLQAPIGEKGKDAPKKTNRS